MNQIELLNFPYPFKAALAICSDIDGTSWENFLTIHKFLNSNQNTVIGRGLSLPVGDAFWMYDQRANTSAAFSYFSDLNGTKSNYVSSIRDIRHAGIIDVLHSYGNFTSAQDFSRKLALKAIEELDKYGLKLNVWTNHGGIESTQNIGKYSCGKGDIVDETSISTKEDLSSFYHSDLLIKYGIKFYWDSESSLTSIVAQNNKSSWSEAYWRSPLYRGFKNKSKSAAKGIISIIDDGYHKISHKHFIPWQPFDIQNALIQNEKLRDNAPIFRFKRFGNGRMDWQGDIYYLLNNKVLERLLEKQGYLILYIHLGDRKNKKNNAALEKSAINRFRYLAQLYHTGNLWLGTTSRVLTYNLVNQNLDWTFSEAEKKFIIKINGLKKYNSWFTPTIEDLSGLSFKIPILKDVEICYKNQKIDIKIFKESNFQIVVIL